MPPQQPYLPPGLPPQQHNPYEFIMNPVQQKPSKFGKNGLLKFAIVIGFVLTILIILFVVGRALLGSNTYDKDLFVQAVQQQEEIIRVAEIAKPKTSSGNVRNFTSNMEAVSLSSQKNLRAYLESKGSKINSDNLSLLEKKSTDDTLASAEQTSTLDEAYLEIAESQLNQLLSTLRKAYNASSGKTAREQLNTSFNAIEDLQAELEAIQP